jgi:hypothetical protein
MIDRRGMLAAAAAWVGAGAARAGRKRPAPTPAPTDLTGVWTNAWYTKLERPAGFKALAATPAEAAAYEAPRRAHGGEITDAPQDAVGQNAAEFPDNGPGLARIRGELRTSWIVDPADGKVPWRPGTEAIRALGQPAASYDDPEARDQEERCLTNPGAAAPILNDHDANLVQFVQTGDVATGGWLAIFGEKNHQVRIVRIAPAPASRAWAPPPIDPRERGVTDWLGTSLGHWEGATLVVETGAMRPGVTMINRNLLVTGKARVIERFTHAPAPAGSRGGPQAGSGAGPRAGMGEIAYSFEVTDETLYTQPIRGEMVFRPAQGAIYEYACHEGNYGLPNILAGARATEALAAKGK